MVYETDFQKTIENAFLTYGASVAQERSIPDVRDALKIGLRQGLYAQFTNKLTHKDKFQKAQKSVSMAMAQSYVHGDAAMYDTFIRAAKPWIYRYPVEAVQGSYGDPCAPDNHSASRYVEMKAGEIADFFFYGLKKNAVEEWYSNYDDTEMIPSVLPSIGYWNIVNGCTGIAVAMTTSVPQFNLKEVNNALIKLIQNPEDSFDNIYCAPDFAQGATILNGEEVKESLKNGHGASIKLRATLQYHPDQNMIQATEMPFGVFTNTIISQLQELTDADDNYGISRVVDHTKKVADIRIYLNKGVNPRRMIEKLYKDTSLENFFPINMTMLDNGRFPKVFGWREACNAYLTHIRNCKRREVQYDLDKALARENVVDGLLLAAANIDEVVAIIRNSESPTHAAERLVSRFGFNEPQVKAILAMKLSSLTKIDSIKLQNEKEQLVEIIKHLTYLLKEPSALDEELIKILKEVADKFGDDRRTKILNVKENNSTDIEPVQEEAVTVTLYDNGILRVVPSENIVGAKRGRKGVNQKPPKGANAISTLDVTNLSTIIAFTSNGKMYSFSVSDFEYGVDSSVYSVMNLANNDKVVLLIDGNSFTSYKYILFVTEQGLVKKSEITDYQVRAKKGTTAIKLKENDSIVSAFLSSNEQDKLMIISTSGNYVFFNHSSISSIGRQATGVKAIKLGENEEVAAATIVKNAISYAGILSISNDGKGKISPLDAFNETNRAVKGNAIMKGSGIAAVYAVPEDKEKILIFSNNKAVEMKVSEIPVQSRATAGIMLIKNPTGKTQIL